MTCLRIWRVFFNRMDDCIERYNTRIKENEWVLNIHRGHVLKDAGTCGEIDQLIREAELKMKKVMEAPLD